MTITDRTFTTFQDYEKRTCDIREFVIDSIRVHKASAEYLTAIEADLYDKQLNKTINDYVQTIYTLTGMSMENFTASNNKIASGFFNRLNTQRCYYSLGNGISFASSDENGDKTKETLGGNDFDTEVIDWGYFALIHGVSFGMWDLDRLHVFPLTEFVPLWDEGTGALRAGIRFWRIADNRPLQAVFYEEDGYTMFASPDDEDSNLAIVQEKRSYKQTLAKAPADRYAEVIGEENYGSLPIIPLWGSRLRQSTLIGLKQPIDAYDIIKSGFANDLTDCAQVYWLIENYGGMTDKDLAKFRDRLLLQHVANIDSSNGGKVTPYAQEIPSAAREALLAELRAGMYEDFCALDTKALSASSKTATEIQASYQPVDNKAADFENQVEKAICALLALLGIEDTPVFTRNKVANQLEQVQMVSLESQYLDQETVLRKLPNISPDEVEGVLERLDGEGLSRITVE